jgi:hypothetical protein
MFYQFILTYSILMYICIILYYIYFIDSMFKVQMDVLQIEIYVNPKK